MKARVPILTAAEKREIRKAMAQDVIQRSELERKFIAAIVQAIALMGVNESEGHGETRLRREYQKMNEVAVRVKEWIEADIAEYMLSKRMRELGLGELADIITTLGHERERWERL